MRPGYAPMSTRSLIFTDLETSHLDRSIGEIVEVGAVRLSSDMTSLEGKVHRLVKMKEPHRADKKALEVNRYDPALWDRHGVDVRVALLEFESLVHGKAGSETPIFVAMNAIFDWQFLERAFEKAMFPMPEVRYVLDLGAIAWPLVKKGLLDRPGLDALCSRYEVVVEGKSHSAMVDCERMIRVYCRLMGTPCPI